MRRGLIPVFLFVILVGAIFFFTSVVSVSHGHRDDAITGEGPESFRAGEDRQWIEKDAKTDTHLISCPTGILHSSITGEPFLNEP
jgi:hypothetical protein